MPRARANFTIDEAARIIFVRYIGDLEAAEAIDSSLEQVARIEHIWEYDHIFDLRRFEGVMLSTEVADMAKQWNQLVCGRDKGRLSAIISPDPFIHSRISLTRSVFPTRIMEVFNGFDEGIDWITRQRADRSQETAV